MSTTGQEVSPFKISGYDGLDGALRHDSAGMGAGTPPCAHGPHSGTAPAATAVLSAAERPANGSKTLRFNPPPHPPPSLFSHDEARFDEDSGVMRDGRLASADWPFKVA